MAAPAPNSDHKNSPHNSCVQGLGGPGTLCLKGNAVRLSKRWARWDANLVIQTVLCLLWRIAQAKPARKLAGAVRPADAC